MSAFGSDRQGGSFDRLDDHILKKKFLRAKMARQTNKMADNIGAT